MLKTMAFLLPLVACVYGGGPTLELHDLEVMEVTPTGLGIELIVRGKTKIPFAEGSPQFELKDCRVVLMGHLGREFNNAQELKEWVDQFKGRTFKYVQCWGTRLTIEGHGKVSEILIATSPTLAGKAD